jgi:hypothetical protein
MLAFASIVKNQATVFCRASHSEMIFVSMIGNGSPTVAHVAEAVAVVVGTSKQIVHKRTMLVLIVPVLCLCATVKISTRLILQHTARLVYQKMPIVQACQVDVLSISCDKNDRLFDSGASAHMVNDVSKLVNVRKFSSTARLADKSKAEITGEGDCFIRSSTNQLMRLTNVLVVPKLRADLISIPCVHVDKAGLSFRGGNDEFVIVDERQNPIMRGVLRDGLYRCDGRIENPAGASVHAVDAPLFHRRFGHMGYFTLAKMSRSNTVTGLLPAAVFSKELHSTKQCGACAESGHKKEPFPRSSHKDVLPNDPFVATKPLEKLHIDISGPRIPSAKWHSWFTVLTCEVTGFKIVVCQWMCDA